MAGSEMNSLWMVAASFLFACMGVCVKLAAARYSAAEIVFYRSVISLALMVIIMRLQGVAFRTAHWRRQAFRGVSGFISLVLYFYAIAMLPLATAVTLNYTSPLFLTLYLAAFGAMALERRLVVVLGIGFLGVVMLLKPTLGADQWMGGLIGLGSGVLAGLAYFNVRALGQLGEPEARTVFYFSLLSSAGGALWMLFFSFHALDGEGIALLLGVGVFATLAQLAMTRSYRAGNPLVSASLAYTAVPFATVFGVVIWGETLTLNGMVAMLVIALSGIAATAMSRTRPINPAEQD